VDISLYRDDVFTGLPRPEIGPTELPFELDGVTIVLVDDVLYTGRTVRAALDALMDFGRPRAVQLAVLVDRGLRELPIRADYVGLTVETTAVESVKVLFGDGGEPRRITLRERA
jgi:pyrimidine operon attenuation protein/uracil phosphoribosyltransferase